MISVSSPPKPIVLVELIRRTKKIMCRNGCSRNERRPYSRRQHLHPDGTHSADPLCPTRSESSCFCRRLRALWCHVNRHENSWIRPPKENVGPSKDTGLEFLKSPSQEPTGLATKTHLIKRIIFVFLWGNWWLLPTSFWRIPGIDIHRVLKNVDGVRCLRFIFWWNSLIYHGRLVLLLLLWLLSSSSLLL